MRVDEFMSLNQFELDIYMDSTLDRLKADVNRNYYLVYLNSLYNGIAINSPNKFPSKPLKIGYEEESQNSLIGSMFITEVKRSDIKNG